MLTNIAVITYSQTGQLTRAAASLVRPLEQAGVKISWIFIEPKIPYPFPWPIRRFFGVFPDSVMGIAPEIKPIDQDKLKDADLVILANQVWFLSPSLPIQGFLASENGRLLSKKNLITLIVSRNMWLSAYQTLRRLIRGVGAKHVGNVVAVDDSPMWASFIMTPRWLLSGRRDRLWGIFPPPGVSDARIESLSEIGKKIVNKRNLFGEEKNITQVIQPICKSETMVETKLIIPEWLGIRLFRFWARAIDRARHFGPVTKGLCYTFFVTSLISSILFLLPVCLLIRVLLTPILEPKLEKIAARIGATVS